MILLQYPNLDGIGCDIILNPRNNEYSYIRTTIDGEYQYHVFYSIFDTALHSILNIINADVSRQLGFLRITPIGDYTEFMLPISMRSYAYYYICNDLEKILKYVLGDRELEVNSDY